MQGTGEGGSEESVFNEDRVSAGKDEKVLETEAGDDSMTVETYLMPQNCTLIFFFFNQSYNLLFHLTFFFNLYILIVHLKLTNMANSILYTFYHKKKAQTIKTYRC